jgi:hypothetical protein
VVNEVGVEGKRIRNNPNNRSRNKIYQVKYVWFVVDRLPGGKSGNDVGMKSLVVPRHVTLNDAKKSSGDSDPTTRNYGNTKRLLEDYERLEHTTSKSYTERLYLGAPTRSIHE